MSKNNEKEKINPKKKRGILESFLLESFDDTVINEAKILISSINETSPQENQDSTKSNLKLIKTKNVTDIVSDNVTTKENDKITDNVTTSPTMSVTNCHSLGQSVCNSQCNSETMPVTMSVTKSEIDFNLIETNISSKGVKLTKRQIEIYNFLIKMGDSGFLPQTIISKSLNIPIRTVRNVIKTLNDKGLLFFKRYQKDNRKGIIYKLNSDAKIDTTHMSMTLSETYESMTMSETISKQHIVSSKLLNKKLTNYSEIENILSNHPELTYWRQKKLTHKQVETWIAEFDLSLEDMIESLCHCRFELVELDRENKPGDPVRNVFDWFYKRLVKSNYYHAPEGYISLEDKKIEREKHRIEEKQKRALELEKLRLAEIEADRKLQFEQILNDPEGELFKKCFDSLNDFDKNRYSNPKKRKSEIFANLMRTAFDQLIEVDVLPYLKEGDSLSG